MGEKVYKPIIKDRDHLIRSKDNPDIIEWEEYDVDDLINDDYEPIMEETKPDRRLEEVSTQIDKAFEQLYFDMDEDEAKTHMMRLVYHMLGIVNEIRIISNARIRKDCESEELCIECRKEAEKFLSGKVAFIFIDWRSFCKYARCFDLRGAKIYHSKGSC